MSDPNEVDDLTAGEREELEAEQSGKAPGADAAAEAGADAADEKGGSAEARDADAAPAAQPDSVNEGVKAMTAAASALARAADTLTAQRAPDAPTAEQAKPRDWDAERAALRSKYDAGELNEDDYEAARERLFEERADARVAAQVAERLAKAEQDASQASWDRTVNAFRADPANAKLFEDAVRQNTFGALVQVAASENPNGSYADWLNAARDRTLAAFGVASTAATDAAQAAAAIEKDAKARAAAAGKPPRTVEAAPAAGSAVQTGPDASLDALPISDLEDTLARLPPDKVEQYLAGAPGGLRDNPRAA